GLIVVALAIGCRESHAAHVDSRAQARVFCVDSIEKRALACSGGAARRVGDTLFVRLDNGREKSFVEDNTSEAPGGYQYEGRVRRPVIMHIVESNGHETAPTYIFLNPRTGREVVLPTDLCSHPIACGSPPLQTVGITAPSSIIRGWKSGE